MNDTQAWRTEMERQVNSLWDRLEAMEQQLAYMTPDAPQDEEYDKGGPEELDFGGVDLGEDDNPDDIEFANPEDEESGYEMLDTED